MRKLLLAVLAVGLMMVSGTGNAVNATSLTIDYTQVLTSSPAGTTPDGPAPWLSATFQDVSGGVLLTVNATGLAGREFTTDLLFNSLVGLNGLQNENRSPSIATVAGFTVDANNINGAGGGNNNRYDLDIQLATANRNGGADRLTDNEIASIFLYGVNGLTALSFNTGSETAGYLSQAHIQGIGGNDDYSAWVIPGPAPVPEPGTLVLLGAGLFGLAIYGKRRLNKQ